MARTRKNRNSRKNRNENVAAAPMNAAMVGGKKKKGSRKLSPGARAWRDHVMKTFRELRQKDRNASFSDALKAAGKTYRK